MRGVGTTFELRLPFSCQHLRAEEVQPAEAATATATAVSRPDESGLALPAAEILANLPHLLVVEDNDEVRAYLQQLFRADYRCQGLRIKIKTSDLCLVRHR